MAPSQDLRVLAAQIADAGPAEVLTGPALGYLEKVIHDRDAVTAVAERVGSDSQAEEWLAGLLDHAHGAVDEPNGDHALLVAELAVLGALIVDDGPEQATVAFEAVRLL